MSNKHRKIAKKKQKQAQEKQMRRQRHFVVFSTALVVVLIVAIASIVLQYQSANNAVQKSPKTSQQEQNKSTPAPKKPATIDYSGQPSIGSTNAPVKIAEFGDYKCMYCKQFEETIFPSLMKDYIKTGKVQFFFFNFPIIPGKGSKMAANAGEAIYRQDPVAFWTFHQALYKNQGQETDNWVTPELLTNIAKQTVPSLDVKKFQASIKDNTYMSDVMSDYNMGVRLGIQQTPTLFVNGKSVNPLNYSAIETKISTALLKNGSTNG